MSSQKGFTMIEAVIALAILSFVPLAIGTIASLGAKQITNASQESDAITYASKVQAGLGKKLNCTKNFINKKYYPTSNYSIDLATSSDFSEKQLWFYDPVTGVPDLTNPLIEITDLSDPSSISKSLGRVDAIQSLVATEASLTFKNVISSDTYAAEFKMTLRPPSAAQGTSVYNRSFAVIVVVDDANTIISCMDNSFEGPALAKIGCELNSGQRGLVYDNKLNMCVPSEIRVNGTATYAECPAGYTLSTPGPSKAACAQTSPTYPEPWLVQGIDGEGKPFTQFTTPTYFRIYERGCGCEWPTTGFDMNVVQCGVMCVPET